MFSSFYTAASGILTQQRILNVISNNIVNAQTPGYRAERVLSTTFELAYLSRVEAGKSVSLGSSTPFRQIREVPVNFDTNAREETGRGLDMAIDGQGFFNIRQQLPEDAQEEPQVYLTRGGSFTIDGEGYLCLEGIGRVLGQKGEIRVQNANFVVQQDGTVYSDRGRKLDVLLITMPQELTQLQKIQNGLYTTDTPEENQPMEGAQVYQGMLEQSNVDTSRELTAAMEAQRAFQSCSQALKIVDAMNQKAATQIASV